MSISKEEAKQWNLTKNKVSGNDFRYCFTGENSTYNKKVGFNVNGISNQLIRI